MASYSFLDVQAAIVGPGGAFSLNNGISEEGLEIAPRDDKGALVVGADGTYLWSLRADKSATITINLLKNSATNAALSNMYNLQQGSSALWGKNVITVTTNFGEMVIMTGVGFKKKPTIGYAKDAAIYVWELECGSVESTINFIP